MIDAKQLGNRLRRIRELCGLSQEVVAHELELPRTALTNIENGNRKVSILELTKLAEIYKCSPSFFLEESEESQAEDIMVVLHRVLPEKMNDPENISSVRSIVDLYREGKGLLKMLDRGIYAEIPNYAAEIKSAGAAVQQGERVAYEERYRLRIGDASIRDIAELLSEQGIWTAAADLPDSMSGLFIHNQSTGFAVLVNADHGLERRRFSYAHEYAHVLFDRDQSVRMTLQKNSSELAEMRANAFASAFLMPSGGVAQWLNSIGKGHPSRLAQVTFNVADGSAMETEIRPRSGSQVITCQDVAVLARRFCVSYDAAVWRLKNLSHVNSAQAHTFLSQKEIAKRHIGLLDKDNQSRRPEQEFHNQLISLAIEAFRREKISRGHLLEIGKKLEVEGEQLLEMAETVRTS